MDQETGYVSEYLTHFVGRCLKEDEAFDLLCHIIKKRKLLPGGSEQNSRGNVKIQETDCFSSNKLLTPEMVCFCDIPHNKKMLLIHTKKYSQFGLAFEKKWLADKGANPVLYVAQGSKCTDHHFPNEHPLRCRIRKEFFDGVVGDWLNDLRSRGYDPAQWPRAENLFFWYLLCYCKFFDETLSEEDKDNFYMEREWRTIGEVIFCPKDIAKVILPQAYKCRFVDDFPDFAGRVYEIS